MICENCGNEHDGTYGSGRFCSKSCRCSFNAKKCKTHPSKKDLIQRGFFKSKKQFGWLCEKCNLVFRTRAELYKHLKDVKHPRKKSVIPPWNKGLTALTNASIANGKQNRHKRFLEGKFRGSFYGKTHTEQTKEKIRKSTAKYIMQTLGSRPRYNKSAIAVLEKIAKEHGWNIQHAENKGEFYTGIGYFVDAYDKDKNIVLEYDEPIHYVDAERNILRDSDIVRQNNIIKHLHCEYWRFNEVTQKLWKVN